MKLKINAPPRDALLLRDPVAAHCHFSICHRCSWRHSAIGREHLLGHFGLLQHADIRAGMTKLVRELEHRFFCCP
jgi:hypothetical protein